MKTLGTRSQINTPRCMTLYSFSINLIKLATKWREEGGGYFDVRTKRRNVLEVGIVKISQKKQLRKKKKSFSC